MSITKNTAEERKTGEIRELRARMREEVAARRKSFADLLKQRYAPQIEKMINGRMSPEEGADLARKMKEEMREGPRKISGEVYAEYRQRIWKIMERPAIEDAAVLTAVETAVMIMRERGLYAPKTVGNALETIANSNAKVEDLDLTREEKERVSLMREMGRLFEKRLETPTLREAIDNTLKGLGHECTPEEIEALEARISRTEAFDLSTDRGRNDLGYILLTILTEGCKDEKPKNDVTPAAPVQAPEPEAVVLAHAPAEQAPQRAAPAARVVTAYNDKGFHITAVVIQRLMAEKKLSEADAKAYIGAIVWGFKLGTPKAAIGGHEFPGSAVRKNFRAFESGLTPDQIIRYLKKEKLILDRKRGQTHALQPCAKDVEGVWGDVLNSLLNQHRMKTENGN